MTKDLLKVPQARSWRDIPQPVKPRTMSGGGRWRLGWAITRVVFATSVFSAVAWGGWKVAAVLQENSRKMPAAAKAVPVGRLAFTTDGVLDDAWLARTLALPRGISLVELDLQKLRNALLASGQVATAMLTRNFPATLAVSISERAPVARVLAQFHDQQHPLFVARDGAIFDGVNFDPAMVETLPWLDGVSLTKHSGTFVPINGMRAVSDLLATAKLEAEPLYRTWQVLSLARLASDGEIEVRTSRNLRVTFGTSEDFFRQLARLDLLLDTAARSHPDQPLAQVNLAIGTQVPVAFVAVAAAQPTHLGSPAISASTPPRPLPFSAASPNLKIQLNREL